MADLLGSITGALGIKSAPDRRIAELDPESKKLLEAGVERATRPESEYAAEANRGIGETSAMLDQGNQQQISAQTGQDPAMLSAISNVYKGQAAKGIDRLASDNQREAVFRKTDALRKWGMRALGQQQIETQNLERMTEAYNQNEMARAGFVSSLFGIGRQAMIMGALRSPKGDKFETQMNNLGPGRAGGYSPNNMGSDFDAGSMA